MATRDAKEETKSEEVFAWRLIVLFQNEKSPATCEILKTFGGLKWDFSRWS